MYLFLSLVFFVEESNLHFFFTAPFHSFISSSLAFLGVYSKTINALYPWFRNTGIISMFVSFKLYFGPMDMLVCNNIRPVYKCIETVERNVVWLKLQYRYARFWVLVRIPLFYDIVNKVICLITRELWYCTKKPFFSHLNFFMFVWLHDSWALETQETQEIQGCIYSFFTGTCHLTTCIMYENRMLYFHMSVDSWSSMS